MSGSKTGVAKRIAKEEPCTVFTHSYGHTLSLAASDTTMKKSKLMKNSLDTTHEITNLIQFSPQCEVIIHELKLRNYHSAGLRLLCPTQ